jgi:lantibiotic modifying enzyme
MSDAIYNGSAGITLYYCRCKKLLNDFRERRGYSHLKEEALNRNMWTAGFGRGFGPVIRKTAK